MVNIENTFKKLQEFLNNDKSKNYMEIGIYLSQLISQVNIENLKKFDKNIGIKLYNKIKGTFDKFSKEIGFNCLRCEKNCCIFSEKQSIEDFDVYLEDINEIKNVDPKLEGLGVFSNRKSYLENIKKYDNVVFTDDEIRDIKYKEMKLYGFEKTLKLIRKNGNLQCFYYNNDKNCCKIHNHKPLICYTFPYKINNTEKKVGLSYCNDCNFNKKYLDYEEFHRISLYKLSYYEYLLSVMLYLKFKNRLDIRKNGIIKPNFKPINKFLVKMNNIRKDKLKVRSENIEV